MTDCPGAATWNARLGVTGWLLQQSLPHNNEHHPNKISIYVGSSYSFGRVGPKYGCHHPALPKLSFTIPQVPSNRGQKALNRCKFKGQAPSLHASVLVYIYVSFHTCIGISLYVYICLYTFIFVFRHLY